MTHLNKFSQTDYVWAALLAVTVILVTTLNAFNVLNAAASWSFGTLTITTFGVFVTLNLLFAFHLIERWIRIFDLPVEKMLWTGISAAIIGFLGSHVFSIMFYYPNLTNSWEAYLDLRVGMSSFGGIITGAVGAVLALGFFRLNILQGLDALAYGFVGGYVFGRAGCAFIHDHPGTTTDFIFATLIDGQLRHDLGFYEMWLMLSILVVFHLRFRTRAPAAGEVMMVFFLIYAPIRFLFDFLRINEPRYAGLTPGQWAAFAFILVGVTCWVRQLKQNKRDKASFLPNDEG
ncbi:MAG: hypothetical protein HKN15_00025 [Xanthomonadales bacterium]|nr:hypothetical protein [Xanthomonadales bacterium]